MSCSCWWISGLMTLQLQGAQTLMKHPKYNGFSTVGPKPPPHSYRQISCFICGDFCSHTSGLHITQRAANTPRFPSCVDDGWLMSSQVLRNALMFVDLFTSSCVKVVTSTSLRAFMGWILLQQHHLVVVLLLLLQTESSPRVQTWTQKQTRSFETVQSFERAAMRAACAHRSPPCSKLVFVKYLLVFSSVLTTSATHPSPQEKRFKYKLLATAHQSLWTRTN